MILVSVIVYCFLALSTFGCGSANNTDPTTTTTTTTTSSTTTTTHIFSTILDGDADETINAMAYDATNSILYIGGNILDVPGPNNNYIVKWNGVSLETVGNGLNGYVTSLKYDNTNHYLYASGSFTKTGDSTVDLPGIAKWNDTSWQAVGNTNASMESTIIQDNSGNLYCGGSYHYGAKKWDGTNWTTLGSLNGNVNGLAYDNNSNYLYACGDFSGYVKKWDGTTWEALGTNGLWGGTITAVNALACNSSGELYIVGDFINVFNDPKADYILKWDGTSWVTVEGYNPSTYQDKPLAAGINNAGKFYTGRYYLNGASVEAWISTSYVPGSIRAISFDNSNNIFIITRYSHDSVAKWTN